MKELLNVFPLKGHITKQILEAADIYNTQNCIGALTLRAALEKAGMSKYSNRISWGDTAGSIYSVPTSEIQSPELEGIHSLRITTFGNLGMINIKRPTEVEFVIVNEENFL